MKMFSVRYSCAVATAAGLITVIAIVLAVYLITRPGSKRVSTVIVDSDGGVDDLLALLMLLKTDNVIVKAVTTVQGNTGVANATRNVQTLLAMMDLQRSINVYPGRDKTGRVMQEGYYGWDGLGDFLPLAAPLNTTKPSAAQMLSKLVSQHPGEIILLCLGPLTNIAEALIYEPHFLNHVKEITIVGASYKGGGNVGPGLEFNMATDPIAAASVFNVVSQNNNAQLIPLETIETYASFPRRWREKLSSIDSKMIEFFDKAENKSLDKDEQWTCYDQTGAAAIINPHFVQQEVKGKLSLDQRGEASFTPTDDNSSGVRVATALNKQLLEDLLIDALIS